MSINESTKKNLLRKSAFIDEVQIIDRIPLFSWIDINITELCNRKCVFCPRVDESFYPNQNLNMSMGLIEKIDSELKELNYAGSIVFSGFGEPLLHPEYLKIIHILSSYHLELVTNGDRLNLDTIDNLHNAGIAYFVVSMYDGPHQREKFESMFKQAGLDEDAFILRDRWHNDTDEFGLKLTNRAGVVQVGKQPEVDVNSACYYLAYSMMVDWNGDILLCVQDWNKRVKAGNIYMDNLWNLWRSPILSKFRNRLINKNRKMSPCNQCNADGKLHGFRHKEHWELIYKEKN
jgi:radical SAM protein with 4Fe4S-binding SPASM domain